MLATVQAKDYTSFRWRGVFIATLIHVVWFGLLGLTLSGQAPMQEHPLVAIAWVLALTMAYTGMFITAHDAMHDLVAPQHPKLNHTFGRMALLLFAAMDYHALRRAHGDHHATPSTPNDPDYHEPDGGGFLRWYLGFVRQYITWRQVITMAIAFNVLHHLLDVSLLQLWLFWIAPQILSTLQLFFFGTWLPHREGPYEGTGPTRTRTVHLPVWLSALTCYHFGYHWEHHAWPFVPWWRLPTAYHARQAQS